MSIVFKNAPIISSGSVPLSTHMARLAESINSRLRSGLADCTKRIHQYTFNLFRQIRNPAEDGLTFPSLGEFPLFYQQLDYDETQATWPIAGKGDFEGANIASPAAQFVFGIGNEDTGTPGEGDNFTTYNFFKAEGTTPEHYWELAKSQRGAYDPFTGAQYAPMLELAQRHFQLTFPDWSRHHKAPGGYLPTPQRDGIDCHDVSSGNPSYWSSYIYKFKRLSDQVIEYTGTGTCGPNYGGSETDIAFIADYPFAWYVYQFNGVAYRFDKSDYIMVNDGGGYPSREDGGQIQRLMVNPFIADFRGTDAQRTQTCFTTPYIDYCFANQDFYTSQYQLSPAYGIDNNGYLTEYYPNYTWISSVASGSANTLYSIPSGFRAGGHLVKQRNIAADVPMQMLQDGVVIHSFTVYKNSGSMVETFLNGPASGVISYRFAGDATINDGGYIYIEQSLLVDAKPEIWDGYALLRMSSARGGIGDDNMDERGIDATYSRAIYDNYRNYGCFLNIHGAVSVEQQEAALNTNPVFDAMRKYVNSFTRTINGTDMQLTSRPMITGYEVSESYENDVTNSRSILYFNRYQSAIGLNTQNIDCFRGMVNTNDSSSNGISTTAQPTGYTNEWVMELCGKPYHPSISSNWEPAYYANYYPYINRCHIKPDFFECSPTFGKDLFRFFQENNSLTSTDLRNELYAPESLTAYNYDTGQGARSPLNKKQYDDPLDANGVIAKAFYQSCQVYPKPYDIESVKVLSNNIVKITFKTRFHHCSGSAPSIIANDVASWNFATVAGEPYRTDENIVRLFLLKMYNDGNNPNAGIGDNSVNSSIQSMPDNPYASIYPTFFFTKLIPKPYANDGIETTGSLDTSGSIPRAYDLQLCETYIRAICEGFVDETLSTTDACNTEFSTDYDYTFSNLCNDAFGRAWISNITGSQRSDYPLTYGPLPDMVLNTQVFNQIGSAVNKLTKVRLPLPYKVLGRKKRYIGAATITPSWPEGENNCNRDGYSKAIQFNFSPAAATTLVSTDDWYDLGAGGSVTTKIDVVCDGYNFVGVTTKEVLELAIDAQDQLSWYACNDDLKSLVSGSVESAAVFTSEITTDKTIDMELTNEQNGCGDQENYWLDETSGMYYNDVGDLTVTNTCTYNNGAVEIDAGTLNITDIAAASIIAPTVAGGVVTCDYSPYKTKELAVVNTRHMIIDVPTED